MNELLMGVSFLIIVVGYLYVREWHIQGRQQRAKEQHAKEQEPPDDAWSRKLKIASNRSKADWKAIRDMHELGRRKYND